ncbi:hypothetical protein FBY34_2434 [Streptomyces sp. SLBN-115]|nr:hypothetical protein FBY34_2434 [Streptomyces sp. SLBN-115]
MELVGRDGLQRLFHGVDRLVCEEAVLVLQMLPAVPVELAGRSDLANGNGP